MSNDAHTHKPHVLPLRTYLLVAGALMILTAITVGVSFIHLGGWNAIVAVGKIGPRPAVYEGQLAIRTMTHLCLTHDHRVIDGVPASLFLGRLKELIEHPELFKKILE